MENVRTVNLHFLVVLDKSVYNYILGRPFVATLDVVTSLLHLKLKFHNLHNEPITVDEDLIGAKRIYNAFQQNQKE